MKQIVTIVLCLLIVGVNATAQEQEARMQAQEMNRRADMMMKKVSDRSIRDSLTIYRAMIDVVSYSLRCDEYDRMPNRKGETRMHFATDNRKRLTVLHERLFDAANFLYRNRFKNEAQTALKIYMNASECPLLKGERDNSGLAACQLARMAMDGCNYKAADRFADIALAYDNSAQTAAEIKAQCMGAQMVTARDSAKYLAVINKLYETNPNNEKYFAWIMQFYDRPQQRYKLEYFVDQQLEENPNMIVPWILKGEIAMKAKRWDEAIEAYQYADGIDPSNVPVAYNIGVCLNSKAFELQEEKKREKGELTTEDEREIKNLLAQSRAYLERVRGRDPQRKRVDWVKPLYMVYTVLGENVKAEELAPLITGFKNKY